MKLEIHHQTTYSYNAPVFLEPQHFYFHPLQRNYLKNASCQVSTNITPRLFSERMDIENNIFHQCWFDEALTLMEITAIIKVETMELNPFNFLEETQPKTEETHAERLYLNKLQLSRELIQWADQVHQSSKQTISFLAGICADIREQWHHQSRYDDSLMHPDECFTQKEGSCRDLSWMLIQVLRYLKMPSRFVSGYSYNPELGEGHELHAWVEVFVNGAGWIGLDPSSGLLTTEAYVPIATSYHPANTLPVQGAYRGDAKSTLSTSVQINIVGD